MAVPSPTVDLAEDFGFLLKDVARLVARNFERHAGPLGLTLPQCRVLAHLQRHEGISQARLAELTDSDPMTLGRLLVRMERDGLVERRPSPRDGRALGLHLRPKALPLLASIRRLADRGRAEALAGLGSDDRRLLMGLLRQVHANLDALTGAPPAAAPARRSRRPADAAAC